MALSIKDVDPRDTLEKVIGINSLSKAVAFFSAADHH